LTEAKALPDLGPYPISSASPLFVVGKCSSSR
jgi:hypothetical protein